MKKLLNAFRSGGQDFVQDDCMSSGAAMAFYTTVALPPLLVVVFFIAGLFNVPQQRIDEIVRNQLGMPALEQAPAAAGGSQDAGYSRVAGKAAETRTSVGSFGTASKVIGLLLILLSATGVFAHLQKALNKAWNVRPDPTQGGVKRFLTKRAFSLGMILVLGLLLLVSFVITTLIDEITGALFGQQSGPLGTAVAVIINNAAAVGIATLLFAATFKILPDARIEWRDVWTGAMITAVLFVLGKSLLGWWLQRSSIGGSWGAAAAAIVTLLVWVYYSSLVVLLGAEVTQAWAEAYGRGIRAAPGAVKSERRAAPA